MTIILIINTNLFFQRQGFGCSHIKYNWQYLEVYIGLHVPTYKSNLPIRSRNVWVAISEINFHLFCWTFFFKFPFFISETCSYLIKGIRVNRIAHTCLLKNTCKSNFYEIQCLSERDPFMSSKNHDTNLDTEPAIDQSSVSQNWLLWIDL